MSTNDKNYFDPEVVIDRENKRVTLYIRFESGKKEIFDFPPDIAMKLGRDFMTYAYMLGEKSDILPEEE